MATFKNVMKWGSIYYFYDNFSFNLVKKKKKNCIEFSFLFIDNWCHTYNMDYVWHVYRFKIKKLSTL